MPVFVFSPDQKGRIYFCADKEIEASDVPAAIAVGISLVEAMDCEGMAIWLGNELVARLPKPKWPSTSAISRSPRRRRVIDWARNDR